MSQRQDMARAADTASLAGKKVTVVGLGRFGGGVGVTRWLCGQGARVTVSDKSGADALADSIKQLGDLRVALHLGGHLEGDFLAADLLVVNPAIPRDMPLLRAALAAGVAQTTEINLFLERCQAPIVGITGSVGKSTTTAMTGAILATGFTTHVGGNIGKSLLEELPDIREGHMVVLELSSFQLEQLPLIGRSPHVAVVTNLAPNHLDRHGTLEEYAEAKKNIFRFQQASDVLVLNASDPTVASWAAQAPSRVEYFDGGPREGREGFAEPFDLRVPGNHNQANAQGAWVAVKQFGISRATAQAALREFAGLPHRLQFVAEIDHVRYFNDSKCTTPQGAIVALQSFPSRTAILIVGGSDKGASFDALGAALAKDAKAVIGIGKTAPAILAAARSHRRGAAPIIEPADGLPAAVARARGLAQNGDVILLSPACASYDMFTNYEHRGAVFTELVLRP